jgi:hypothetical protein
MKALLAAAALTAITFANPAHAWTEEEDRAIGASALILCDMRKGNLTERQAGVLVQQVFDRLNVSTTILTPETSDFIWRLPCS